MRQNEASPHSTNRREKLDDYLDAAAEWSVFTGDIMHVSTKPNVGDDDQTQGDRRGFNRASTHHDAPMKFNSASSMGASCASVTSSAAGVAPAGGNGGSDAARPAVGAINGMDRLGGIAMDVAKSPLPPQGAPPPPSPSGSGRAPSAVRLEAPALTTFAF